LHICHVIVKMTFHAPKRALAEARIDWFSPSSTLSTRARKDRREIKRARRAVALAKADWNFRKILDAIWKWAYSAEH